MAISCIVGEIYEYSSQETQISKTQLYLTTISQNAKTIGLQCGERKPCWYDVQLLDTACDIQTDAIKHGPTVSFNYYWTNAGYISGVWIGPRLIVTQSWRVWRET